MCSVRSVDLCSRIRVAPRDGPDPIMTGFGADRIRRRHFPSQGVAGRTARVARAPGKNAR
jgi:hypothetical protein